FTYVHSSNQQRGQNLNAPVNGVRPNSAFTNIIEVRTDAKQRQQQLNNNITVSLSRPSAAVNAPRWNLKRTQFQLFYIVGQVRNSTEGPFVPPSTANLTDDWGPANNDIRQRMNFSANTRALMNVQMSAPDDARYHLNFTVQALNLTNHANYTGFIGTLTSPFFGKPTTVNNMRKIEFLVNFQF